MTIETLRVVKKLKELSVNCDLIDLRTVSPIDF